MSQSISFFQFDEASVTRFWEQCLQSGFSVSETSHVANLANVIRYIEKDEYSNDLESAVWEIDDLIVNHFSKRHFFENLTDMLDAVDFWLHVQVDKSLERDFDGDFEKIDRQTWHTIFENPKRLTQIKELLENASGRTSYGDPSAEQLLDDYLRIRDVFDYSWLTGTEMVVLHEDRSQSERWSGRIAELAAKALPVFKELHAKSNQASEYRQPPFLTIPVASKEFFVPSITVIKDDFVVPISYVNQETLELKYDLWAGRVLPGDTYEAALCRELAETLGYTGAYEVLPMKTLLGQVPDNSGMLVNRYGIEVKLVDEFNTNVRVMGHTVQLAESQRKRLHRAQPANGETVQTPTRDDVIAALKKAFEIVPVKEIGDPVRIYGFAYTDKIKEFEVADRMYDAWVSAEEKKAIAAGDVARAEFDFLHSTIYWDAGFDAFDYLDDLANDWLMQDEDRAREKGLTDLADRIQATIDVMNARLDEIEKQGS